MKPLSEPALQFIKKVGKNKDFAIDLDLLEDHLRIYHLEDSSEILRFQKNFAGLHFQDTVIYIFTPEQIRERKTVKTHEWNGQTLFPINNGLYMAENGEIAVRDCGCNSHDFYFYFERFDIFIEQQAFFEKHRYYKKLPAYSHEITDLKEFSARMSGYGFLPDCSDRYNLMWKNEVSLVHATCHENAWSVGIDSISEQNRSKLIEQLKDVIQ
ncbi:hypothetical protein QE422_003337 [Chryseobacterium sp. SORGH_AS 447]|uniref:hypothetical protein n=1 Tax=Chryseobacterium sp. SORGH_AS_0447 TaxID=3041769 RepID=UPI00277D93E3|nr:hypothetical protein [Chryseobacterium sp. SORGH_AS_0447]MDQ1162969.1 hypothetical protein [Chryseobacterium sp. SORGH_AS_0447]